MIAVPQFAACRPWSEPHLIHSLHRQKSKRHCQLLGIPGNSVVSSKESAVLKGEIPDVRSLAGECQEFGDLLSAVAIPAWRTRDSVARWRGIASWKPQESATSERDRADLPEQSGIRRHGTGWNPSRQCPGIRYLLNSVLSFAGRTRNAVMRREKDYSQGGSGNSVHSEVDRAAGWKKQESSTRGEEGHQLENQETSVPSKVQSTSRKSFFGRYPAFTTECFWCFNFLICGLIFSSGHIDYFSEDLSVPEDETFSSSFTAFGELFGAALHYHYGFGGRTARS